MGRKAEELSAIKVSRLTKPGMHAVGGVAGLHLQVLPAPSTARTWILRVMVGGKRREIGLGAYSANGMTLARAREAALEKRAMIEAGKDPVEERKAAKSAAAAARASAISFTEAATKFIEAQSPGWKSAKHAQQWTNTLTQYAYPVIGGMLVRDVQQTHILRILEPIWTDRNETASRLRGRMEKVLDWATVRGYRSGENPARWRGYLEHQLAKPSKVQKTDNFSALAYDDMNSFMVAVLLHQGMSARALEFAILTAARSGEVRGATWAEMDLDAAVWTIPAERMKAEKEHRVPLSSQAVALLRALGVKKGTDLIFPNGKGGKLSDMALTKLIRDMDGSKDGGWRERVTGKVITAHGFRSTFRDWAGETTAYPREVIEHALAHQLKDKAEAAYARGTLFDKRRRLMADWANYCDAGLAKASVTPIRKKSKTAA